VNDIFFFLLGICSHIKAVGGLFLSLFFHVFGNYSNLSTCDSLWLMASYKLRCISKNIHNFTVQYLSQRSTDFNNFWCTKYWGNSAHSICKISVHYIVKQTISACGLAVRFQFQGHKTFQCSQLHFKLIINLLNIFIYYYWLVQLSQSQAPFCFSENVWLQSFLMDTITLFNPYNVKCFLLLNKQNGAYTNCSAVVN